MSDAHLELPFPTHIKSAAGALTFTAFLTPPFSRDLRNFSAPRIDLDGRPSKLASMTERAFARRIHSLVTVFEAPPFP